MEPSRTELIHDVLAETSRRLAALYETRLVRLELFGSVARGDDRPESDVDVLVVLADPVDTLAEIRNLAPVALDLWLRYSVDVQLMPFSESRFLDPAHPFADTVRREGVSIVASGAFA